MSSKYWMGKVRNDQWCKGPSNTCTDDWVDTIIPKVEKVSWQLAQKIRPFVDEVAQTLEKLELFGIHARQSIIFHPLALVFNSRITDGVCFEVVRPGRRADVLAAGGRYVCGLSEISPI